MLGARNLPPKKRKDSENSSQMKSFKHSLRMTLEEEETPNMSSLTPLL
jgi:hypothetical protein